MTRLVRLLLLLGFFLAPLSAFAAPRMALVIGMGAYRSITPLDNTRNDAKAIGDTLERIGFSVTRLEDATQADAAAALEKFAFDSQVAEIALIYFAGHGVEIDGVNYLVPVDVAPRSADDIKAQSLTLKQMLDAVDDARRIRIVILDACRDNPFSKEIAQTVAPAGTTDVNTAKPAPAGGLAPAEPDPDTLVVFAARDGQVAYDGSGDNSPFATALMAAFSEPGLEIGLMFRKVRDLVREQTGNRQQSYPYGSLSSESVYFIPPATAVVADAGALETVELAVNDVEQLIQAGTRGARPDASGTESLATRDLKRAAKILLDPSDPTRYDPERAVELLTLAADAGDPEATWLLATFHEKGLHVPVDEARALALFRAAADLGFDKALNDLGFMYSQGLLGLVPDQTRAFQLFEQAARERHPQALFNFAVLIDQGVVPGRTPADAAGYLFDAVRTGQKDVLTLLCARPEMFSAATRSELQRIMGRLGFYDGAIDASFGVGTTRGIALAYGTPEDQITDAALTSCTFG
jgi:hypothetical protein